MRPRQRPIHCGEKLRTFIGMVHRESLPIIAMTKIGKETGRIFVKMQEGAAFGIENPELFLDKNAAPAQVLDHIAKRRECRCVSVFHREGL